MDYNKEIPFEKRPASGFYDTAVEVTYNSTSVFVGYSNHYFEYLLTLFESLALFVPVIHILNIFGLNKQDHFGLYL